MAELSTLVSSYLDQNPETYGTLLLKCLESRQLLNNQSWSEEFVGRLNALLASKDQRWLGVALLGTTLQQCDTDTFTSNCAAWIRAILQILQFPGDHAAMTKYCVHILDKILKYAGDFSELSRELSGSIITSALSTLLTTKAQDGTTVLAALSSCIIHFPGPVGPFRNRIEKFVLPFFDSPIEDIRKAACYCFAILPRCGGEGGGGNKRAANWEMHWKKILGTIHSLLTAAYENLHSVPAVPPCSSETLPLANIPVVEPARTHTLVTRCCALLDCLSHMIREELSSPVTVPLQDSIHLLHLILSVNDHSLMNVVSVELVLLKATLPVIHQSAVEFLTALVCRCGNDLLPHGNTIVKLLVQLLTWTSCKDMCYGQQRPFGQLRFSTYACLETWVHTTGCLSLDDSDISKLLQQIMDDAKPQSSQTTLLSSSNTEPQRRSKKAKKRKLQEDVGQLLTGQQKNNIYANEVVTFKALKALSTILIGAGADIPVDIYQQLQIFILKLVMQCQQSQQLPIPYTSGDCRHSLYHALLSCLLTHPPQVLSPVHHAVRLFSLGLQDKELKVANFCREALAISVAIIHPRVPPQISSATGTLLVTNQGLATNKDPSPTPALVNQFGFNESKQVTESRLSGNASFRVASVNGNPQDVDLMHEDQTVRREDHTQPEQKTRKELSNSPIPQEIPSTSANMTDSYTTNETTEAIETPAGINDTQLVTQTSISLNEHGGGLLPNPVWDSQSTQEYTEHDLVQSSTQTFGMASQDTAIEEERPVFTMETDSEVFPEGDEASEVERILQSFVDSNPDSE